MGNARRYARPAVPLLAIGILVVFAVHHLDPAAPPAPAASGAEPGTGRSPHHARPSASGGPGVPSLQSPYPGQRAGPPEVGANEVAQGSSEAGTVAVEVARLEDGVVVPNLEIRFARVPGRLTAENASSTRTTSSDEFGRIPYPADGEWATECARSEWRTLAQSSDEIRRDGRLWVYRMVWVLAAIETVGSGEVTLDRRAVTFNALPSGDATETALKQADPPWSRDWLQQRGLDVHWAVRSEFVGSRVRFSVPALRGLVVQAAANGWRPASHDLPLPVPAGGEINMTFTLQRARVLRGLVRAADTGDVLAGALVGAYVVQEVPAGDVTPSRLRLAGHAVKAAISAKEGKATVIYVADVRTGKDGAFELLLFVDGDVLLTVHPNEPYGPVRRQVRDEARVESTVDIEVRRRQDVGCVRLTVGDVSIPGHLVSVGNLSAGIAQPVFDATLDARSEMSTHLLEAGHRYMFVVEPTDPPTQIRGVAHGEVLWEGQSIIELPAR